MLYCDLEVGGVPIWYAVPCLNGVSINSHPYLAFDGDLIFIDTQGANDPAYDGLSDRYVLLYIQAGADDLQISLQAVPSQQISVTLGSQNCTISLYTREVL
jgi:hypothetical protein